MGNPKYVVSIAKVLKVSSLGGFKKYTMFKFLRKNNTIDGNWLKVSDLKVGMQIAVPKDGILDAHNAGQINSREWIGDDVLWDEIESIEYVGTEQVWDIEVEDTHNFVGNNIFAHNTYLQGNLGVGINPATAQLNIAAGTATANTAPLKFTSGALLTTPEAGAVEFLTDAYYGTITTGAARKQFAFTDSNITGSAATLTNTRTIWGQNFNGSANVSGALTGATTGSFSGALSAASLSLGSGTITSGLINGQTISSAANFTGTANVAGVLTTGGITDAGFNRITNPGGASYTTSTATVNGAIAVILPVAMGNQMIRMTIKVYEYTTNESFEIHAGGYMYPTGNTWANNPFAYIVGNPGVDRRFTVRFGYTAGGKAVVYIGELGSTWSYPQVNVTDVEVGHSGNSAALASGWSIGFQPTAFENVTATITNPQVGYAVSINTANSSVLRDSSGNFSAGTITAALTGHASLDLALTGGTMTGDITTNSNIVSTARNKGLVGTYDSTLTDQVWSMGASYTNNATGADFGNLYGMAYCHTNNVNCKVGLGHQIEFVNAGTVGTAIGFAGGIWTNGSITGTGLVLGSGTITTTGTITSGLINGQTISSAANFTGTAAVAGALTVTGVTNANGGLSQDGNVVLNGTDTWLRTTGATGWYSTTYTGGWYMTDTSWIRNYNAKPLYLTGNGTTAATFMSGYVGIGTTAPASELEIARTGAINTQLLTLSDDLTSGISNGEILFNNTGAGGIDFGIGHILNNTSFAIRDLTNGGSPYRMVINTTGNVGIGTTAPGMKLDVKGTSGFPAVIGDVGTGILRLENSSGSQILDIGQDNSTGLAWLQATSSMDLSQKWAIALNPNGGNVGIGTMAPGATFEVNGNTIVDSASASYSEGIRINRSSAGYAGIHLGGAASTVAGTAVGEWIIQRDSNLGLAMYENTSTLGLYIKSGGNVGIGTTGPQYKLSLGSTDDQIGFYSSATAYSNIKFYNSTNGAMVFDNRNPSTGGYSFRYATSPLLDITKDGNVGIGTTGPKSKLDVNGGLAVGTYAGVNAAPANGMIISGNVGIGTTAPAANLHVYTTTSAQPTFRLNSNFANGNSIDFNPFITGVSNDGLNILQNGTSRMVIGSTGNVGIGTTNPGTYKLNVAGTGYFSGAVTINGRVSQTGLGNSTYFGYQAGNSDDLSSNNNVGIGYGALYSNTTGYQNTANGYAALYSNTTGYQNTANGYQALFSNTTGYQNTANGYAALYSNTTGYYNTANGLQALYSNTTGNQNTANGDTALYSNTTGNQNTANGYEALFSNTTGYYNTANGLQALYSNTTGYQNTANGYQALFSNTTGIQNTANGLQALFSNTTGYQNTANGMYALFSNTTGIQNTANGMNAGRYISAGTANATSNNSVYLGYDTRALLDGDTNEIVIGSTAIGNGSNTVTLGNDSITKTILKGYVGIGTMNPAQPLDVTLAATGPVAIFRSNAGYCQINPNSSTMQCSSDINLKKNITTLDSDNTNFILNTFPDMSTKTTYEKILSITPVIYNWKTELDTDSKHIGFIAQEIEQVFPNIVNTDPTTGLKSVGYTNLIPYTIQAIQELNLKIEGIGDMNIDNSFRSILISWLGNIGNGIGDIIAGTFKAKDKLCINDTCVTESQLQSLLASANVGGGGGGGGSSGGDSTAPVITRTGDAMINIDINGTYTDLGATAVDNVDGDITANIIIGGDTVDTAVSAIYTITYNVSDAAGNNATEVTREVNVGGYVVPAGTPPADTIAPVITLNGASEITLVVGDAYSDAGATGMDNIDGDITANITTGGNFVDTTTAGTYVITYNVSDVAGNSAAEVVRTIIVN